MTTPKDIADQVAAAAQSATSSASGLPSATNLDYEFSPGGSMADDYSLETGRCCADRVAGVLGVGFSLLTQMLARIANALEDKLNDPCEKLDSCMDKIEKEIRKRFEAPTATCDECKRMVEQGLAGTVEYAVRCAGACAEDQAKVCSLGSPETWGKPCKECGSECCTCDKGICKPTDCPEKPPEKPKEKFIGWCNPLTGSIAVTKQSAGPPGIGFVQVSLADDEQAAAISAANNCHKQEQFPTFNPSVPIVQSGSILCSFDKYANNSALSALLAGSAAVNLADAHRQLAKGILGVGFEGLNPGQLGEVIYGLVRTLTGLPPYMSSQLLPTLAGALGCNNTQWQEGVRTLGQIMSVSNYIGADLGEFTTQLRYALNAGCRQKFLDPDKAVAAFLGDTINYQQLDTHFAVNGFCPESVGQYINAARSKPVPLQLAVMRRRKMINSNQYAQQMRQLGYLETSTSEQLFNLTEQVPTLSDIIRLMVRDADDEQLVSQLGLDTQFDRKYGRQLRKWSEDQGVPELFAKYAWRAHWTIPSPTQLFTFYHRLRHNSEFGGQDKVLADIKSALIQQDILPYWHEHYLATSFHPIGRVDIRRAYNIGALTDDELVPSYVQLGYSDATSEILARFTRRLRDIALVGHRAIKLWIKGLLDGPQVEARMQADGIPAVKVQEAMRDAEGAFATSPAAAAFVRARIDRAEFRRILTSQGVSIHGFDRIADSLALKRVDSAPLKNYIVGSVEREAALSEMTADGTLPAIAESLLTEADQTIENAMVISCQRGIKRRFIYGELDQTEAQNELQARGTTATRAARLAVAWECEKTATSKAITSAKLCHWLSIGAITAADLSRRLKKLGYTDADAALMVQDCLQSISVKRAAQAAKEAKEQFAAEQRAAAAQRRLESQLQRLANQAARASAAATRAKYNREKQLLSVGQNIADKCDCELVDALGAARSGVQRMQNNFGLSVDEALQAAILASEEWQGGDLGTIDSVFDSFAETAAGIDSAAAAMPSQN